MSMKTFPLGLPQDLYDEASRLSKETGLAMADVLRQGFRLGLPKLEEQTKAGRGKLKPFTREEARACWVKPHELDEFEHHSAGLARPEPARQ
jgi:hypothetical protein